MIEFLRKFENRGIIIAQVNWILIAKSFDLQLFTLILYGVLGRPWLGVVVIEGDFHCIVNL